MMVKRALVLGGGGLIGVAWESGLCAGLLESGVDLRQAAVFVGTSAGAIIGSQLACGMLPPGPDAPPPAHSRGANVDPSRLDMKALGEAFTRWSKIERATLEDKRGIGAVVRTLYRDTEDEWVRGISAVARVERWPDTPMVISAVDTESGERALFDRHHGVEIGRAIAASASVPGVFASVEIGGRLYMDGQVHSSTHADALLLHPGLPTVEEVLIAMPTNRVTAPGIGTHAEREVQAEIEALRAAGLGVHFVTPQPEHGERLGKNLMDARRVPDAFSVGLEVGRTLARDLGA